jgi:Fe-S-cluster-containing hydrogenase component 2
MKFEMPSCGGCRTCELACSFHHRGEFNPAISSLKILEKPDGPGYLVVLKEESDRSGLACDRCEGLDIPLCVQYCREMDELRDVLHRFWAIRSETKTAEMADSEVQHVKG